MARMFIIGDVHGQLRRLEQLLLQEGIIGPCKMCAADGAEKPCSICNGNGLTRIDFETEVVQLGDLMDFMPIRTSEANDERIAHFADQWIDVFLWGNHETPARSGPHFGGFVPPMDSIMVILDKWRQEGRLKLAHYFSDYFETYLITHAGLGDRAFENVRTGSLDRYSPRRLANWLNHWDKRRPYPPADQQRQSLDYGSLDANVWPMRDNIGPDRGGWCNGGGVIWRDSREGLWLVPQVFGHTSHPEPLTIEHDGLTSYCIDTSKDNAIAAIWLPEMRLVNLHDSDDYEWN